MLNKSKTSAVIMSSIAILTTFMTFLILERVFFVQEDVLAGVDFTSGDFILAVAVVLLILIFAVLPGAFLIHGLDDSHFGMAGGFRWLLFGLLTGAIATVAIQSLPPTDLDESFLAYLGKRAFRAVIGLLILGFTYVIAFKANRLFRREGAEEYER